MPLLPGGVLLGAGLWRHQPLAIIVELGLAALALAAFVLRAPMSAGRKAVVCVVTALFGGLTAMGAFGNTPPPGILVFAWSSLGLNFVAVAMAAWADRPQRALLQK